MERNGVEDEDEGGGEGSPGTGRGEGYARVFFPLIQMYIAALVYVCMSGYVTPPLSLSLKALSRHSPASREELLSYVH